MSEETNNPDTTAHLESEDGVDLGAEQEASSVDAMAPADPDLVDEEEDSAEVYDFGPLDDALVKLVQLAVTTVSEVKAEDIVIIDVRGRTSYCDVLVLCTGITGRQVRAIANQLLSSHKRAGRGRPLGAEGLDAGRWALVDMGDVVVHVFDDPWRGYYDLDGLWMDAPRVSMDEVGLTEEGLMPRVDEPVEA